MNRYIMKYCVLLLAVFAIQTANAQTVDLSTHVTGTPPAGAAVQWHNSATPSAGTLLPSTTVTATNTPANYWVYYYDADNDCYSPGAKVTIVSNVCPATTVNLASLPSTPAPAGATLEWYTSSTPSAGTHVANPNAVGNGTYWPAFYDADNDCWSPVGNPVIVSIGQCFCVKQGSTDAATLFTKVGILTKGSITNSTGSIKWPENVPSGHIVMDSENKGFVITHMTTTQRDLLVPVKGMMIYNTTLGCVQIYRGTQTGADVPNLEPARYGWHCIERGCNE